MNYFQLLLLESEDVVQQVLTRLKEIRSARYWSPIDEDDLVTMRHDIESKVRAGWTCSELVQYLRNTEEVDPDLDEDRALANMAKVKKQAALRLKLTAQVVPAIAALKAGDKQPILKLQQELIDDGYDLKITSGEVVISTEHGEKITALKR